MANQTVYPYGTNGSLPSSIGLINDLATGGADKALTAEQGKVVGEELYGSGRTLVDLTALTEYGVYVATATNKWAEYVGSGFVFIPVTPGDKYQIAASGNKATVYFVTQDSSHSAGNTPTYATGYSTTLSVSANTMSEPFTIPQDGHYIALMVKGSNELLNPSAYKIEDGIVTPGLVERVGELEENTATLIDEVEGEGRTMVDVSALTKYNAYIELATGLWASSNYVDVVFVSVNPGDSLQIIGSSRGTPYAFLQTNAHTTGTAASFCSGYEQGYTVNPGETVEITIPNDGHYLAVWTKLTSGDTTPQLYRITGELVGGLMDRVKKLEDYKDAIDFFPAGVNDNLVDYLKSIQIKTKVLTIREQEMAPTSGVNITAYDGHLYCTINGVKYEINITQVNNE